MTKNTHGGRRTGSGRKPNPNRATVVKRIPQKLIPAVDALIKSYGGSAQIKTGAPIPLDAFSIANELSYLQIPVSLEKIPAGFASPAEGYSEDHLDFNEYLVANQAATIVVRCGGDSMLDAGIAKDDLLVVDRSIEPRHRDIVLADLGAEYTIKRLYMTNGRIELHSENSHEHYPNYTFNDGDTLSVVGVVMHVLKDMRKR